MEKWQDSNIVFDGKVVRLRVGTVLLDDDTPAYREVVEHPGGACILPYTGQEFVFVRQYRIALETHLLEAPAGKLEVGETPEECAVKELREETGFLAERIVDLGKVFSSVGYCNEKIHLYLAVGLTQVGSELEPEERIDPVYMSIQSVRKAVTDHSFTDGKTAIIAARALAWLDRENP